jgi:hypothetical protein
MVGDTRQNVGEPGLPINIVELGGHEEAVHESGPLPATIGAGEQAGLRSRAIQFGDPLGGVVKGHDDRRHSRGMFDKASCRTCRFDRVAPFARSSIGLACTRA